MLTNREKNTLQRVIFVLRQLADDADSSKTADIIMDDIATLQEIIKKSDNGVESDELNPEDFE